MSDTVKLIIEIPKEDYEFTKGAKTARYFPPEYYVNLILNGTPLGSNSENSTEIIRCKDCKYAKIADPEDNQDGYTCQFHRGSIWFSGSYCSWAEKGSK